MSYDLHQVFLQVLRRLSAEPLLSLTALARELRISRNTLAKAVQSHAHKGLREVRAELLLTRTHDALSRERLLSVKEWSFNAGYKSPRAFARAIRRVYGCTPQQLRATAADRATARGPSDRSCEQRSATPPAENPAAHGEAAVPNFANGVDPAIGAREGR